MPRCRVARARSDAEVEHLRKHGATTVIMREQEIAKSMLVDLRLHLAGSPEQSISTC